VKDGRLPQAGSSVIFPSMQQAMLLAVLLSALLALGLLLRPAR
jgi:hypothetical protein